MYRALLRFIVICSFGVLFLLGVVCCAVIWGPLPWWALAATAIVGLALLVGALRRRAARRASASPAPASPLNSSSQPEDPPAGRNGGEGGGGRLAQWMGRGAAAIIGFVALNIITPVIQRYVPAVGTFLDELFNLKAVEVAAQGWPAGGGCDFETAVAIPKGGPSPERFTFTFAEDPRVAVVKKGGVSWESGLLSLTLSANRVVHLESITPVILSRNQKPEISWVLTRRLGCGPGSGVFLRLDLDESRLLSVTPDGVFPEGSPKGPKVKGVKISPDDPLSIEMQVKSCKAAYSWMLKITYVSEGRKGEIEIGSPEAPFRSAGGVPGVAIYDVQAGEAEGRYQVQKMKEVTTNKCEPYA